MGLISNATFTGIADRIASQVGALKTGINNTVGGTQFYPRVYAGVSPGDYEVENGLITPANSADANTMSGSLFSSVYSSLVNGLETHVLSKNAPSFNSYLNTSGINVHPNFDEVYYRTKNAHLLARNVHFSDANILVATVTVVSSGVGTYASVAPVGTSPDSVFDPAVVNYGAAKFIVVPIQTTGAAAVLDVRLTQENLVGGTKIASKNVSIGGSVDSGTQFVVDASEKYLDCTNIVIAGGNTADVYNVYALQERGIAL